MTDKNGEVLITQTEAAELRNMSLTAVNQHVRSGRWRSILKYGKRLVYRADVVAFEPMTHKKKHQKAARKVSVKKPAKKTRK